MAANSKARVAVIEDDVQIKDLYVFKLEKDGFNVKSAGDGASGLKLVEDFKPVLILLDLMMPEMTGDEMLAKLRAKSWGKNIKVIILTNISKDEAPSKLRSLNVDRYIVKAHYTPKQVVEIAKEVLAS